MAPGDYLILHRHRHLHFYIRLGLHVMDSAEDGCLSCKVVLKTCNHSVDSQPLRSYLVLGEVGGEVGGEVEYPLAVVIVNVV